MESLFFTVGVMASSGDLRVIPLSLGLRGVLEGLAGHPAFTALVGAAIGNLIAAPAGARLRPALLLVGAVIVVLVLHGVIDADPIPDAVRWVTGALTVVLVAWAWVASVRTLGRKCPK